MTIQIVAPYDSVTSARHLPQWRQRSGALLDSLARRFNETLRRAAVDSRALPAAYREDPKALAHDGNMLNALRQCVKDGTLYYATRDFSTLLSGAQQEYHPTGQDLVGLDRLDLAPMLIFLAEPVELQLASGDVTRVRVLGLSPALDPVLGTTKALAIIAVDDDDMYYAGLALAVEPGEAAVRQSGQAAILRLGLAARLLLSQAGLVEVEERQPTELDRRRAKKKRQPPPEPVTVIDLRRAVKKGVADVEHAERTYNHRWIVRGHWRSQVCGPGRTGRRQTYIAPYVKGPDGAPLVEKERVFRW